jgi:hypothetical protein
MMKTLIRLPGTRDAPRLAYTDLVRDFIEATSSMPAEEVARIALLNPATVQRWRLVGVRRVNRDTLGRLADFLQSPTPVLRAGQPADSAGIPGTVRG